MVFDPRAFDGESPFTDDGFPFTVGSTSGGLRRGSVAAAFDTRVAGTPRGTFRHLKVTFRAGLTGRQALRFGVDRDLVVSAFGATEGGNGADELGGATLFPRRTAVRGGMRFTAVRVDGTRFSGVIENRLGRGYSPVDGNGFIDAERAVLGR